jgi:hypothetical protein
MGVRNEILGITGCTLHTFGSSVPDTPQDSLFGLQIRTETAGTQDEPDVPPETTTTTALPPSTLTAPPREGKIRIHTDLRVDADGLLKRYELLKDEVNRLYFYDEDRIRMWDEDKLGWYDEHGYPPNFTEYERLTQEDKDVVDWSRRPFDDDTW